MKQSHADIFCLDEDGWCLACRVLFHFFFSLPRLFCLASPESRYVFGQLPSYLLLHSNCHRALLTTQPCFSLPCALTSGEEGSSASHSPDCYTHIYLFLFTGSGSSRVYSPKPKMATFLTFDQCYGKFYLIHYLSIHIAQYSNDY